MKNMRTPDVFKEGEVKIGADELGRAKFTVKTKQIQEMPKPSEDG